MLKDKNKGTFFGFCNKKIKKEWAELNGYKMPRPEHVMRSHGEPIERRIKSMENKENLKAKQLKDDITFNAKITIQNKLSKDNNIYQVMIIGVENEKTGEILNIHEVYIKEHLRQIIEFIISQNKE